MNPQRMTSNCTCLVKVKEHVACSVEIPSAKVPLKPNCYLLRIKQRAIGPEGSEFQKNFEGLDLQIPWGKQKMLIRLLLFSGSPF